jgi:hypothetical protein
VFLRKLDTTVQFETAVIEQALRLANSSMEG